MTLLVPDANPSAVLALARRLARCYDSWGALERDDYVGLACLGFYQARERWTEEHLAGYFDHYAMKCMSGAIREARRREAYHQGFPCRTAPSPKAANSSPAQPAGSNADGRSVSPLVSTPRYRRRSSRAEHNQTYYYQHYEKHAQRDYRRHVKRLGARALPYAEWRERRERKRHLETVAA